MNAFDEEFLRIKRLIAEQSENDEEETASKIKSKVIAKLQDLGYKDSSDGRTLIKDVNHEKYRLDIHIQKDLGGSDDVEHTPFSNMIMFALPGAPHNSYTLQMKDIKVDAQYSYKEVLGAYISKLDDLANEYKNEAAQLVISTLKKDLETLTE